MVPLQVTSPEHSATPLLGSISAEGMQHLLNATATSSLGIGSLGTLVMPLTLSVYLSPNTHLPPPSQTPLPPTPYLATMDAGGLTSG